MNRMRHHTRAAGLLAAAICALSCTEAAPPVVGEVLPDWAPQGVATALEIRGSGFEPVLRASYRVGGRSEILFSFSASLDEHRLQDVVRLDNETLRALAPADLPLGTYDLRVESPDGLVGTLADAFTVRPGQADAGTEEGGVRDVAPADAGPADHSAADRAVLDAPPADMAAADAVAADTTPVDTLIPDTTPVDTALPDTTPVDTALPDTTPVDTAPPDSGVPPDWFDPAWRCRARIGFDTTALATDDLIDFPALVRLEASWPGYARAAGDGRDLRFVDPSRQLLPHEIEEWSPTGTSIVWVGVPWLSRGSTSEFLYIYFDNSAAADAQDSAAVFQNGYQAVFHLNQDLLDSSANGNHGTNVGSTPTAGYLAGGRAFVHAQEQEIAIGDTNLPMGTSARSLCAWTSTTALDPTVKHWFISYGEFTDRGGFFIGRVRDELWCGGVGDDIIAANIYSLDTWGYQCCVVRPDRYVLLYADGVAVRGPERHGTWSVAPGEALIGGHINPSAPEHWDGALDEVRISSVDRSADWLLAEFLSMTGDLLSIDAPQCLD